MARNEKQNRRPARENRTPAYIAWHVAGTEDKTFWTRIGAAWSHQDNEGLTLQLDLVPVNSGRIVLRHPSDEHSNNGAGA
ncbi:conserved hypothetical protein [Hyphomicrobiales bacterium]|nr:conserved hypothetical protein [Hyphomicrobiales bacterium]CAH1698724.1 conserved hypothetical protein [Hyphomicrobiales bacterium]CAI0342372.1 conserved hypothetical protein [Hyphomicrobiales bacterium]